MELQQFDELMDMLTGEALPEGISMPNQPSLNRQEAFSTIWFLQEHLRILPDNVEMCGVCEALFDSDDQGFIVDGTDVPDEWNQSLNVTKEMLEQNDGAKFCSSLCEFDYWQEARPACAPSTLADDSALSQKQR